MWAIPTGTSSVLKKKNQVKSPSIWSRVPEIGSDPPIGSDRDSGRDTTGKPICSSTWHNSFGNRRGIDSARVRFLRWTLPSKWNKEAIMSSAGLNQKP